MPIGTLVPVALPQAHGLQDRSLFLLTDAQTARLLGGKIQALPGPSFFLGGEDLLPEENLFGVFQCGDGLWIEADQLKSGNKSRGKL